MAMELDHAWTVAHVHGSLRHLRQLSTVSDIVQQTPQRLAGLGYTRSMVSRLHEEHWIARSAYAADNTEIAVAVLQLSQAVPGKIGREDPESAAIRDRAALLVTGARTRADVHRRLADLTRTETYVVAPIIVGDEVIGMIHVDRVGDTPAVAEFDRAILALFAEGMGAVLEHASLRERVHHYHQQVVGKTQLLGPTDMGGAVFGPRCALPIIERDPMFGPEAPAGLTRRELDVLRLIGPGLTNPQIAKRLFISVGTVKTHVKSILRKLEVSSRDQAVSRFRHIATQEAAGCCGVCADAEACAPLA